MGFWDTLGTIGRSVAGVYTAGLSEAGLAAGHAIFDKNAPSGALAPAQAAAQKAQATGVGPASVDFDYNQNPLAAQQLTRGYQAKGSSIANENTGPYATQLDNAGYNNALQAQEASRRSQGQALNYYQNMMMGVGPSVAQQQMLAGRDANIAQSMALANSARGGAQNYAAAQYAAQQQGANATQQTAGQAAALRAQEQATAAAGYGGVANDMRSADLSSAALANTNANQVANLAVGQEQYGNNMRYQYDQMAEQIRQNQLNARIQYENNVLGWRNDATARYTNAASNSTQRYTAGRQADAQLNTAVVGAIGQGLGAAASASDRNLKTDIHDGSTSVRDALDNLKPYNYSYKDQMYGLGPRNGVMAQDLEKSALGSDVVIDTPNGKMIDNAKSVSLALAGLADMNVRMKKLEGGKK